MIEQVVRLSCRRAVSVASLCNKLGLSEAELRNLVAKARRQGYVCSITDGFVSTKVPQGARGTITLGSAKPGRHSFLHFTDIHFGSRYCDRTALAETFARARKRGVKTAVCTGDVLDGFKEVLIHEQRKVGFDGQATEATDFMRKHAKGFSVVAIDGNHDGYHSNAIGFVSGEVLAQRMREVGVAWQFAGVCLGRAIVHGAHVQMWHPHGGAGTRNAVRRVLNSRAETLEERCDILLVGHFHKFATVPTYPEGVFCAGGGTYQRKASEFANRISGGWDIGGTIVSYDVDAKGRVSHVAAEFMAADGARVFDSENF